MSKVFRFNLTVERTPVPTNLQMNLFGDPQPSITRGLRRISRHQYHPAPFPHDTPPHLPMTRAFLCVRRARKGRNYIAVQIVPPGVEPLRILNLARAEKHGIEIVYIGEGYRERNGRRSSYGKAIAAAKAYIAASGLIDAGEF
jgi:hypothetical protein